MKSYDYDIAWHLKLSFISRLPYYMIRYAVILLESHCVVIDLSIPRVLLMMPNHVCNHADALERTPGDILNSTCEFYFVFCVYHQIIYCFDIVCWLLAHDVCTKMPMMRTARPRP